MGKVKNAIKSTASRVLDIIAPSRVIIRELKALNRTITRIEDNFISCTNTNSRGYGSRRFIVTGSWND